MGSVRVIIVNYRTANLVIDCLRSLAAEVASETDCRVIVVDNRSSDDSVSRLREAIETNRWPWVTLMPLDTNGGFGAGNNAAIQVLMRSESPPDYFYLLNPDTISRPGAVRNLREFLDSHPKVSMAGGRLEEPDGTPQTSAFRFPNLPAIFDGGLRLGIFSKLVRKFLIPMPAAETPHRAEWLTGASVMIRRSVFERIGLFDEGYFLYYEEVDLFLRAHRKGLSGWHVPASRVIHLEGKSTGVSASQHKLRPMPRYWFDSRRRYFLKNYGWFTLLVANLAFLLPFALYRLRRRLQRKEETDPPRFLWDFLRYSF